MHRPSVVIQTDPSGLGQPGGPGPIVELASELVPEDGGSKLESPIVNAAASRVGNTVEPDPAPALCPDPAPDWPLVMLPEDEPDATPVEEPEPPELELPEFEPEEEDDDPLLGSPACVVPPVGSQAMGMIAASTTANGARTRCARKGVAS
jgi:hypothetical protein